MLVVSLFFFLSITVGFAAPVDSWFNTRDPGQVPQSRITGEFEIDDFETTTFRGKILSVPLSPSGSTIDLDMEELAKRLPTRMATRPSDSDQENPGNGTIERPLPEGSFRPLFLKSILDQNGKWRTCVSIRFLGLFCADLEKDELQQSKGLPDRYTSEDYSGPILKRDIQDLWQNPKNPAQVYAINKHDLLLSMDYGNSFVRITPEPYVGRSKKPLLSSIAGKFDPTTGRVHSLFVGTTIYGILIFSVPVKNSFTRMEEITTGIPGRRHDPGLVMYEEITGLEFDQERGLLVGSTLFQSSLIAAKIEPGKPIRFRHTPIPLQDDSLALESFNYNPLTGEGIAWTREGLYKTKIQDGPEGTGFSNEFGFAPLDSLFDEPEADDYMVGLVSEDGFTGKKSITLKNPPKDSRGIRRDINGFYVSIVSARKKQYIINRYIDLYKFNAVVIDYKDDMGRLLAGSNLPEAIELNNSRKRGPIRKLVSQLKKKGIYTIARIVVFKDPTYFRYHNGKYAIKDRITGGPWMGNGDERWVNPFSVEVQNYNIRVAREAVENGFDEIQFDYIRFPTDGPIWRTGFDDRELDIYRSEALENFLRKARIALPVPITADIYGYNGIYRAGGTMGQDFIDMGEFLDGISPMHYSSHFGSAYLAEIGKENRTYALLRVGSHRPTYQGKGRFIVRPWLQAFKMFIHRWGWGEGYMADQILGTLDGGGDGFLWWGPIKEFSLPGQTGRKIFEKE